MTDDWKNALSARIERHCARSEAKSEGLYLHIVAATFLFLVALALPVTETFIIANALTIALPIVAGSEEDIRPPAPVAIWLLLLVSELAYAFCLDRRTLLRLVAAAFAFCASLGVAALAAVYYGDAMAVAGGAVGGLGLSIWIGALLCIAPIVGALCGHGGWIQFRLASEKFEASATANSIRRRYRSAEVALNAARELKATPAPTLADAMQLSARLTAEAAARVQGELEAALRDRDRTGEAKTAHASFLEDELNKREDFFGAHKVKGD